MTHFLGVNYTKDLEALAKEIIEEINGKDCWVDQEGKGNFGIFDPPFCISMLDKPTSGVIDGGFPYWDFDQSIPGWDQALKYFFDTDHIIVDEDGKQISREIFEVKYLPRADARFQVVEISE